MHEQNSIVEHLHHYIVEIDLTLLSQCYAPLKFWSYAFKTAMYLINRIPTIVQNGHNPFESLCKSSPDYNFLCIFKCLCFSLLLPCNKYKIDFFYLLPCVFLGYSTSYLGYRCLDLSSKRMYITRHICFYGKCFSFGIF